MQHFCVATLTSLPSFALMKRFFSCSVLLLQTGLFKHWLMDEPACQLIWIFNLSVPVSSVVFFLQVDGELLSDSLSDGRIMYLVSDRHPAKTKNTQASYWKQTSSKKPQGANRRNLLSTHFTQVIRNNNYLWKLLQFFFTCGLWDFKNNISNMQHNAKFLRGTNALEISFASTVPAKFFYSSSNASRA